MTQAPSTLEGAYALHLMYHIDWCAWHDLKPRKQSKLLKATVAMLDNLVARDQREEAGAVYQVLGHKADLMFVFLRRTARELGLVERALTRLPIYQFLEPAWSYLSVVELSLHGVAERNRATLVKDGLEEGTPEWNRALDELLERDREAQRTRLYPEIPPGYLCFYPMNKKRGESINWFTLSPKERGSMMAAHGKTGRKYFGKVSQIISSSMGYDDWDWGVDLFAADPLHFKKLIYEMRYDPVSAIYADFGPFFLGLRVEPGRLLERHPWPDEPLDPE